MPLTTTPTSQDRHIIDEALPIIRAPCAQDFPCIQQLLAETNDLYPGIEGWWQRAVQPELHAGQRVALVLEEDHSLHGVFIGKPGKRAKVCTLRLRVGARRKGLGTLLLAEGVRQLAGPKTNEVYVTVSEAAEPGCAQFFENFGFGLAAVERNRYVQGVDEFVYSAEAQGLKGHLTKILRQRGEHTLFGLVPKASESHRCDVVMSIHPEFANLMLQGKKTVEFRRRFSERHAGARVWFYVTQPAQAFTLAAQISHVDRENLGRLWEMHRDKAGISHQVFKNYFAGAERGFALSLSSLSPLPQPVPLARARESYPGFKPPQAFRVFELGHPLLDAIENAQPKGVPNGNWHPLQAGSS